MGHTASADRSQLSILHRICWRCSNTTSPSRIPTQLSSSEVTAPLPLGHIPVLREATVLRKPFGRERHPQGYDLLLCQISFSSNQAVEVAVNLFSLAGIIYTFRHRFLLSLFL